VVDRRPATGLGSQNPDSGPDARDDLLIAATASAGARRIVTYTLEGLFTTGDCERRDSGRRKSAAEASQAQSVEHRKVYRVFGR